MSAAVNAVIRQNVEVVTKMLLGQATMRPSLFITAGQLMSPAGIVRIAQLAAASDRDTIHLDFHIENDHAMLRDIIIAVPRDNKCFVHRGCRLAQRPSDRHAVLMPKPAVRGHFRVAPGEIIQVDRKPADLAGEGLRYAERRFARLLRDGVEVTGQVVLREVSQDAVN